MDRLRIGTSIKCDSSEYIGIWRALKLNGFDTDSFKNDDGSWSIVIVALPDEVVKHR